MISLRLAKTTGQIIEYNKIGLNLHFIGLVLVGRNNGCYIGDTKQFYPLYKELCRFFYVYRLALSLIY